MKKRLGTGRRWAARLAAGTLAVGLLLGLSAAPARADYTPDPGNCHPAGVPDDAGSGMPGRIDDRPAGGDGSTLYERYGWSGLQWHTCDLGDPPGLNSWYPDVAVDTVAWLDTSAGNLFLGLASTLGALMAQLNQWVTSPGAMFAPVDKSLAVVADAVRTSTWALWSALLVVVVAVVIAARAAAGDVRRAGRSVVAVLVAAASVAALGTTFNTSNGPEPGAVALGTMFDGVATGVVGQTAGAVAGGANDDIAYGATLYDQILVPIWAEGQVGTNPGTLTEQALSVNSRAYDNPTSKSAEDMIDAYRTFAKNLYNSDQTRYLQVNGKGGGRAGLGFMALVTMAMIALIRIPCSVLILMGLIVIRFVVMFIPVWALFGLLEATRPTAKAAGKMVLAAVYNTAVFGVFGVVHTAVVSSIIKDGTGFTFLKLVLILVLTLVTWVVSKPFRSLTVPATGDALTGAGQHVSDSMRRRGRATAGFAGAYWANRLANRRGGGRGRDGGGADMVPEPEPERAGDGVAPAQAWSTETYAVEQIREQRPRRTRSAGGPGTVPPSISGWTPPGSQPELSETMRYRRDRERFMREDTLWTGPDTPPITVSLPPTGAYDDPSAYGVVDTEWREIQMRRREVAIRGQQIRERLGAVPPGPSVATYVAVPSPPPVYRPYEPGLERPGPAGGRE